MNEPLAAVVADALGELSYENPRPGSFLVRLPGEHKLATMCWLVIGTHSLMVDAFVMRHPDENAEKLHEFLLRRNARMFAVSFSIDSYGDVYLSGRLPLAAVAAAEIDRILGAVLCYADDDFDTMLEIGFATSIRAEWRWRAARGEPLHNLAAFARFADPERDRE